MGSVNEGVAKSDLKFLLGSLTFSVGERFGRLSPRQYRVDLHLEHVDEVWKLERRRMCVAEAKVYNRTKSPCVGDISRAIRVVDGVIRQLNPVNGLQACVIRQSVRVNLAEDIVIRLLFPVIRFREVVIR